MRLIERTDSKEKPAVLTPWSLVHVASGAASRSYTGFWSAELIHLIYELIGSKRVFNLFGFKITKESSIINSVGDQASFTLGRALPKSDMWTWATVGMAIVFSSLGVEF